MADSSSSSEDECLSTAVSVASDDSDISLSSGNSHSSGSEDDDLPLSMWRGVAGQPSRTATQSQRPSVWSKDLSNKVKEGFTGPDPGPSETLDTSANELDFFQLFIPQKIIEVSV